MKTRIVVLASGSGTNFQALIDAADAGTLDAGIAALVGSRSGIGAIERAVKHGIPVHLIDYALPDADKQLTECVTQLKPDLIVLAGWLKKIPVSLIKYYEGRIVNIHPSLLPDFGGKGFYGRRVHEAVLAAGRLESGCTVHLVTEQYDEGPILAQTRVPVQAGDTPESLGKRILQEEHTLYPATIQKLISSGFHNHTLKIHS